MAIQGADGLDGRIADIEATMRRNKVSSYRCLSAEEKELERAAAEIEITPAMIEAGVSEISRVWVAFPAWVEFPACPESLSKTVTAVYRAMCLARP